jgi:low temperature requirement protein LtrA
MRRSVHATRPQGVSFVELFFDLVFVFAVTQITALTAHDLTAANLLRSIRCGADAHRGLG